MQAGKRYTLWQTIGWQKKPTFYFALWSTVPVSLDYFLGWKWLEIPWQPVSLIGIAVAFYLGFKSNSAYDRLWEARKIWGAIVNASRSFTVMVRDFVTNEFATEKISEGELHEIHKGIMNRHITWLYAMTVQLRELKEWEHNSPSEQRFRQAFGTDFSKERLDDVTRCMCNDDAEYLKDKKNKASHLLSLQSMAIKELKFKGLIDDFRHMELQSMITEFYAEQGKSERIKNFPFPRQYATANYFLVVIFLFLLPISLLGIFKEMGSNMIWLTIPFSTLASWVYWVMESIGEYSENPFEGLYNDVPISTIARSIEIDIRQMLEEKDLPEALQPMSDYKILM